MHEYNELHKNNRIPLSLESISATSASFDRIRQAYLMLDRSHHGAVERGFRKKNHMFPHHPQHIHTEYWNDTLHSSRCKSPVSNIFPFQQAAEHLKCRAHCLIPLIVDCCVLLLCSLVVSIVLKRINFIHKPPPMHILRRRYNFISIVVVVIVTII